jgi:HSP20 family molecular chaperone IbpA
VRIRLTTHAREQMQEQEDDVTEEQIQTVLHHFHTSVPGSQPTTVRYVGFIDDGRELSVVAELPGVAKEPVKIITVYWEN